MPVQRDGQGIEEMTTPTEGGRELEERLEEIANDIDRWLLSEDDEVLLSVNVASPAYIRSAARLLSRAQAVVEASRPFARQVIVHRVAEDVRALASAIAAYEGER